MARKKVQKNLQLPQQVADWLDREESNTGISKSRIAIAAFLAWRTRLFHEKRVFVKLATEVDKDGKEWIPALAGLISKGGTIGFADQELQKEMDQSLMTPIGESHRFVMKDDGASQKKKATRGKGKKKGRK